VRELLISVLGSEVAPHLIDALKNHLVNASVNHPILDITPHLVPADTYHPPPGIQAHLVCAYQTPPSSWHTQPPRVRQPLAWDKAIVEVILRQLLDSLSPGIWSATHPRCMFKIPLLEFLMPRRPVVLNQHPELRGWCPTL